MNIQDISRKKDRPFLNRKNTRKRLKNRTSKTRSYVLKDYVALNVHCVLVLHSMYNVKMSAWAHCYTCCHMILAGVAKFFWDLFLLLFSIGLPRQSLQNLQPCRPFFAVKATAGGWRHRHPTSLCTMNGIEKFCPKILLFCVYILHILFYWCVYFCYIGLCFYFLQIWFHFKS